MSSYSGGPNGGYFPVNASSGVLIRYRGNTNGNGLLDLVDLDANGDGIPDGWARFIANAPGSTHFDHDVVKSRVPAPSRPPVRQVGLNGRRSPDNPAIFRKI